MKDKSDLVQGWLLKAESDLVAARLMVESEGPYDTACFHCQQAIEKLLKAFLLHHDQKILHTHDLEELARLCSLFDTTLEWESLDLEQIADYAVAARYDFEFWPDPNVAREALGKAEKLKEEILGRLQQGVESHQTSGESAEPEDAPSTT